MSSQFYREVLSQGSALRAAARAYREQEGRRVREAARLSAGRPILLTGMGSSYAAALAGEAYLVSGGRLAVAVEASEALYRWLPVIGGNRGLMPVLISQSGESPEVVKLASKIASPLIAITNQPESTLGRRAAVTLPLHAGSEEGVTNQTFLNSVALAALLARALLVDAREEKLLDMACLLWAAEVLEAVSAVDGLLARDPGPGEALRNHLAGPEPESGSARASAAASGPPGEPAALGSWDLIGRGTGLAAVEQGSLMLRELTSRMVMPQSGGLYRHGPVYRSDARTRAIILASRDEEGALLVRLAADILERGGRVAFIADFNPELTAPGMHFLALPPVARGLFPLTAVVPLQLLAVEDTAARGFQPGPGGPKVTPVE